MPDFTSMWDHVDGLSVPVTLYLGGAWSVVDEADVTEDETDETLDETDATEDETVDEADVTEDEGGRLEVVRLGLGFQIVEECEDLGAVVDGGWRAVQLDQIDLVDV